MQPLLCRTRIHAQIRILLQHLPRDLRLKHLKDVQELSGSNLSKATKLGLFPLVEKPLEIAAMEKQSYCQTRKRLLICLLIFGAPFWTAFKPKSNHTRQQLPALVPSLGSRTRGRSRDGKSC